MSYLITGVYSNDVLRCINRAICLVLEKPEIECILQLRGSGECEAKSIINMYYQLCNLVDNRNRGNKLVFDSNDIYYGLSNVPM